MADHMYRCQPIMEKTAVDYMPPPENPAYRPMVVVSPCYCGDSHTWQVEIPPTAWRLVTKLGQGGLADE